MKPKESMKYHDFVIEIERKRDGQFPVQVISSPAGEERGLLNLPFSHTDLESIFPSLGVIINNPDRGDTGEDSNKTDLTGWSPRQLGIALFDALFNGKIRDCYQESRGRCNGQGLRIKLRIDPVDESLVKISRLPWEIMHEPNEPSPMVLHRDTALVRYLEAPEPVNPLPMPSPLKVLAVVSTPKGLHDFGKEKFIEDFRGAWESGQDVELQFLNKPTLQRLRKYLRDEDYHILHFTGHGGLHRGEWCLAFEDENGAVDYVTGEDLAATIRLDKDYLQLITLISCEGARPGKSTEFNPFNGVANALVRTGFPAVLAMQYSISVEGAFIFTRMFYDRLVRGDQVDIAANEARMSLFHKNRQSMEWAVPALFMRTEDGILFDLSAKNQAVYINTVLTGLDLDKRREKQECKVFLDLSQWFKGADRRNRKAIYSGVWNEKIFPELLALQRELDPEKPVDIDGQFWLSIWFALGHVFSAPSRFHVHLSQFNQAKGINEIWRTDGEPEDTPIEVDKEDGDEDADELVITVSINNAIDDEVGRYLKRDADFSYRKWLRLKPMRDPDRNLIANSGQALGMANAMAKKIREAVKQYDIRKTHLFIAAPGGFALFLSRRLTVTRQIQVYEYQDPGYAPSFLLGGKG